ncbi:hypothetical protein [Streptomyces aureoversilis]|uniref:Aspartate/glutamate/uridylate kinase domain-containing protein n=1 Tax=Streptomyces aureoversilis TaxID=67277 RepID=A0ABW0A4A2_9ACTN
MTPAAQEIAPGEPRTVVIKVGGSLVSDKRSDDHIDHDALRDYAALVAALATARPGRVVFVAGGGALGHGAVRTTDAPGPHALLPLTQATFRVKWAWTQALCAAGVRAMPLQVAALAREDAGGVRTQTAVPAQLLRSGILPVLSGDCIVTADGSLRIMGSDEVPGVMVAEDFAPVRVVTLTDVPGILTGTGHDSPVLRHVDPDEADPAGALFWPTASWDTSDAMRGKVQALAGHARRGAECVITQGDRRARSLLHLFSPMERWPDDVPHTLISRTPAAI